MWDKRSIFALHVFLFLLDIFLVLSYFNTALCTVCCFFYQCTLFTCNFSLVIQANDFTLWTLFSLTCVCIYMYNGNWQSFMVLFWPILAPKYEVPKLNTAKYVTLQKLTTKIEHCLNIFLYLYSLVCTFLSYFFPK
jgi:hypothetical protein